MRYLIYLFALVLMTNVSCTMTQKYSFNEDLSGKTTIKVDMSAMKALAGEGDGEDGEDPLGSMMEDEEFQQSLEDLENIKGINNVSMVEDEENGIIEMSYDFENMEILNKSMAGTDVLAQGSGGNTDGHIYFTKKSNGKKLIYKIPKMEPKEGEELDMGEMEGMDEMFKYELVMEFAKPVKKLKTKSGATLSSDKKTITWNSTLTKIASGEATPTMQIKF